MAGKIRELERTEKEVKKLLDIETKEGKDVSMILNLYFEICAIQKRSAKLKDQMNKDIVSKAQELFSEEDKSIRKTVDLGEFLVKVGKESSRDNTSYDIDNIVKQLKKLLPKYKKLIEQLLQKNRELAKSPASPRLYVFNKEDQKEFQNLLSSKAKVDESYVIKHSKEFGEKIKKLLKHMGSNFKKGISDFVDVFKDTADDIYKELDKVYKMKNTVKENEDIIDDIIVEDDTTDDESIMSQNESHDLVEEIKRTKDEVQKCVKDGPYKTILSEMATDYLEVCDVATRATKLSEEIKADIKKEFKSYFDEADDVIAKYLEVGDLMAVVCANSGKVSTKKMVSGFIDDLKEAFPQFELAIENILSANTKISSSSIKPRLSVKQTQKESISESMIYELKENYEKLMKLNKKLTSTFSKINHNLADDLQKLKGATKNIMVHVEESKHNVEEKHFCAFVNGTIFGVGDSEVEAIENAQKWIGDSKMLEVAPCTEKLFNYVEDKGSPEKDEWRVKNKVAALASELDELDEQLQEAIVNINKKLKLA